MELELKKLEDLAEAIVSDFAYMKSREKLMRDTNGKMTLPHVSGNLRVNQHQKCWSQCGMLGDVAREASCLYQVSSFIPLSYCVWNLGNCATYSRGEQLSWKQTSFTSLSMIYSLV